MEEQNIELMKNLYCLLLCSQSFCLMGQSIDMKLEAAKKDYSSEDSIKVTITNRTGKPWDFVLGIEGKYQGEWFEIINDLEDPSREFTYISTIGIGDSQERVLIAKKLIKVKSKLEKAEEFRFYLGFSGPNERDYKDKVVSEAFVIRE